MFGKRKIRGLSLSLAGKWYILLAIAIGVVALTTGNNAIYLIESFVLAGLIFSGILSERTISAIEIEFIRGQAVAGEPASDWIQVTNTAKSPCFCVEVGEWKSGKFVPLAFLPRIAAGAVLRVRSEQVIPARGPYRWDGFAIATSYPFGLANKTRIEWIEGERLVWPARKAKNQREQDLFMQTFMSRRVTHFEVIEGEIRSYDPMTDDARMIVAQASVRGLGPMVRNRRGSISDPQVVLHLDSLLSAEEFEKAVKNAAAPFHCVDQGQLVLTGGEKREILSGKKKILDRLAVIRATERKRVA